MNPPLYKISHSNISPEFKGLWEGPAWASIVPLLVDSFRPEGSSHKPLTQCKLQYDSKGLYGIFRVEDQYLKCVHTEFQSDVYKDSCVEIFLEPIPGKGYFNFEFNCMGVLKTSNITDTTKINGKMRGKRYLDIKADMRIKRYHSIKMIRDSEADRPLTWYLEFLIPLDVFEKYLESPVQMNVWRGNLFKCGDETSHPHWASWAPIPELNFHLLDSFGTLEFVSG